MHANFLDNMGARNVYACKKKRDKYLWFTDNAGGGVWSLKENKGIMIQ